jgi:hypothetical protein
MGSTHVPTSLYVRDLHEKAGSHSLPLTTADLLHVLANTRIKTIPFVPYERKQRERETLQCSGLAKVKFMDFSDNKI